MTRKGKTSQRTILFRQNVNRDNEEWAHFLEGYREWLMDWDMTTLRNERRGVFTAPFISHKRLRGRLLSRGYRRRRRVRRPRRRSGGGGRFVVWQGASQKAKALEMRRRNGGASATAFGG